MTKNPEITALLVAAGIKPFAEAKLSLGMNHCIFPGHNDSGASFSIFEPEPGVFCFKCHGCNRKGDALGFIMALRRISFPAAVERLRADCGLPPAPAYKPVEFNQNIAASRLTEALPYLAERGITEDVARKYGVGAVDFPGLGLAVSIPYGVEKDGKPVVKFRAVKPPNPKDKFRHNLGTTTDDLLYGEAILDNEDYPFTTDLWITESELDALMLRSYGYKTVSVSSATSSLENGKLKYAPELLKKIADTSDRIFVATDLDKAGNENAAAWLNGLPKYKVHRVSWPFRGKESGDAKDLGDLYKKSAEEFRDRLEKLEVDALKPPWHRTFHRIDELPEGELEMLIDGILPEGITFLGSLSGVGKTWVALSMAAALTNKKPFMGVWQVPEVQNVLYLVPESGAKAFKRRAQIMRINPDRFLCMTMNDGVPISLDDPMLSMLLADLKPVVFLDTAIRFAIGGDENSASENANGLAKGIFSMINKGAKAIVGLHHSIKASAEKEGMTLETVLRGSGDLGAMCDCVWGIQHDRGGEGDGQEFLDESQRLTRLFLKCVKPRDMDPPPESFRIVARPDEENSYLNDDGDFHVLLGETAPRAKRKAVEIVQWLEQYPDTSIENVRKKFRVSTKTAKAYAKEGGLEYEAGPVGKSGQWKRLVEAA